MARTRLSNSRATTGILEAPNVTSAKQPTSSTWGRDRACIAGRGKGRNATTGNHSITTRTSRETHAPLQALTQTYTFGNKEVSLQEFLKLKSPKFTDGTFRALRLLGCSSERSVELETYKLEDIANTWYEIKDEGQGSRGVCNLCVRNKAKIGGSYSGDLGANHKIGNQGRQ
ncbi:hypothetical protein R3W88_014858 [Solanum pinnatisectum]|uniref:Uncharacterized protein n=1 Tax=Solanum pinnatisectum TaxID=50273 RepID=A0AAV9KV62_9SOLN|nr:hypothetical protein R3W88_014858 [Solanum pinnatisectum]